VSVDENNEEGAGENDWAGSKTASKRKERKNRRPSSAMELKIYRSGATTFGSRGKQHKVKARHCPVQPLCMRHWDGTASRYEHEEILADPSPWFPYSADSGDVIGKRIPLRTDLDERHANSKLVTQSYYCDWKSGKPKPRYYTKPARTPRWDPASKKAIVAAQYREKNASVMKSGWSGFCSLKDDARYTLHGFARAGQDIPQWGITQMKSST